MTGARRKILIVEDEVISAMSLTELLQLWGHEVCDSVSSGEEAIQRAQDERPDMVLIDINIRGGMDGLQAAREIRRRLGIPIVIMTGYQDRDMRERARELEPAGYLVKPLDLDELKSIIDSTQ